MPDPVNAGVQLDLLQIGVLPEWVEHELAQSFNVHRLVETPKRAGALAELGPHIRCIATRGDLGARSVNGGAIFVQWGGVKVCHLC